MCQNRNRHINEIGWLNLFLPFFFKFTGTAFLRLLEKDTYIFLH